MGQREGTHGRASFAQIENRRCNQRPTAAVIEHTASLYAAIARSIRAAERCGKLTTP